jgi:predicted nucleic acid-binding protein
VTVYFCDSSVLVKCYVQEHGSAWMRSLLDSTAGHHLYLAAITGVEVIAAVTRRLRRGDMAATDSAAAVAQFRQDFTRRYRLIDLTQPLVARAMTLAETHSLRGYDAVQLATAVEVHMRGLALGLPPLPLVSADGELNMAARAEGLMVEDPNTH